MVILSAGDWVCIFGLFVVEMRHPAQCATGCWLMPGLVFKWFPLCEFSLIDTPFSCKDGLDKGQKWYGPTEAEDIKKRWQEYTEELYKKDLHYGVITALEPDILECEVK